MSSESDILAFQNSVEDNLDAASTVLFNGKRWAYIVDSTSNSGNFGSGQIQFDLSSFASQAQWLNLAEAVIEFPVKIIAKANNASAATISPNVNSIIQKAGWHQWIDTCQLMLNGQTIQAAQPFENVATTWRILSKWSQDELIKQGPTCGFAIDDMTGGGTTSTALLATNGLANAATSVATAGKGFDAVNNQTVLLNKGIADRASFINNGVTASTLQAQILGTGGVASAGRSNVGTAAGATGLNTVALSAFAMATVRLKDLCDISDIPMCKNLKGYLYLSFNSSQVDVTANGANSIDVVGVQVLSGRTTPFLVNHAASSGFTFSGAGPQVRITGSVNGTTDGQVGNAGPILTNARMLMPYYLANPKADAVLSQTNKFFTTLEKIQFTIDVGAGKSANPTITSGVPNPRRIVMVPTLVGLGTNTTIPLPELSPFDTVPATSGPFAGLSQLQVYVANAPVYQYPVTYDYEQFLQEQSQVGLNGNQSNEETSGLLTEQLWTQNHRFYTVDLSRRMDAEDGSSKSVALSFINPTAYTAHIIGHLYYEKRWVMDTTTCTISPL